MLDLIGEIAQITSGSRPLSASELGRLAVLRHELGARTIGKLPGKMPPAPLEDIFEGVIGVPEVSGAELTGAHVASGLRLHGVLVVRGLVSPADVKRLSSLIDGKDWGTSQCPVDANGEPLKGAAPMKCSAASLQGLIEAYQNAGMGAVMTDYLGESPVLLSDRLEIDRRILKAGLPWHQDGGFFGGQVGAVNSFLALDHCGVEAPGLSVVPRRFEELIGVEAGKRANLEYGKTFKPADVIELAGPGGIVTPVLAPGDAIFFDEMTLHRTGAAPRKSKPRYWAITRFFFPPRNPKPRSWAITWFFAPSRFPEHRHPLWFG